MGTFQTAITSTGRGNKFVFAALVSVLLGLGGILISQAHALDRKTDPAGVFLDRCDASRAYDQRDCRCISQAIEKQYSGQDLNIAFLYGDLTVMAEDEIISLRGYLLSKKCDQIPLSDAMDEMRRHHKLPIYLFRELYLLGMTRAEYFAWGKDEKMSRLWSNCHQPSAALLAAEEDLQACLSTSVGLEGCSRCHDGKGVELPQ